MTQPEITIHGATIPCRDAKYKIDRLLFLRDNPRVYSCIAGVRDFDDLFPDQQQQKIYETLLREPSVKTLIPDIRHNGGLIEPILVRADTEEVIEGNSRLAAYRHLYSNTRDNKWTQIPCRIVSGLTDDQLAALLHSIHVKGKTSWTRYEKAYFIFLQRAKGKSYKDIANLFSISQTTARRDVRIIQSMEDNNDPNRTHFSYYQVVETTPVLKQQLKRNDQLKSVLLSMIRSADETDSPPFTAQQLRDQLPVVLKKRKILGKFVRGEIDLETAHDRAKISNTQARLKKVRDILNDVTKTELGALETSSKRAVEYECRKIQKEITRITKILAAMISK